MSDALTPRVAVTVLLRSVTRPIDSEAKVRNSYVREAFSPTRSAHRHLRFGFTLLLPILDDLATNHKHRRTRPDRLVELRVQRRERALALELVLQPLQHGI